DDKRYAQLVGKHVLIPLINRQIPIILDKYANIEKETGCVKITPAHDFNDYHIGLKHNLPMINIFTLDGKIIANPEIYNYQDQKININQINIPKEFHSLNRCDARKKVIDSIARLQLLEKIKPFTAVVSYGDRSGVVLEPIVTKQWYLKTSKLAEMAIKTVKDKNIVFFPKQYNNLYFSWMNNIQDWCISRQLWWGHRIPIWYDNYNNIYVGHNETEIRKKYCIVNNIQLVQEEDVLDTWFSSALWTFSTLGWPKKTKFLKLFHSTNVLVSGFDIIFFWIARMIMLTMYFIKDLEGNPQVPFKKVYITGLIRDEHGKKMSKSKGNIIDPLDMIDGISLEKLLKKRTKHLIKSNVEKEIITRTKKIFPKGISPTGTDALRFTCTSLASNTRDIHWDMNRLQGYRNFCNKLWNVSRFVLMNITPQDIIQKNTNNKLSLIDIWITSELNSVIKVYRKALDTYRFDIASNILYDFIWNKFCDWYIEFVKALIYHTSNNKHNKLYLMSTKTTLINTLESLLRLAHPIIPFITEEIWQRIKILTNIQEKTIMLQKIPEYSKDIVDESVKLTILWIQKIIIAIRKLRLSIKSLSNNFIPIFLCNVNQILKNILKKHSFYIQRLARITSITIISNNQRPKFSISTFIDKTEIIIVVQGLINKRHELYFLNQEIEKVKLQIQKLEIQISNKNFIILAPKHIVSKLKLDLIHLQRHQYELIKKTELISSL
ncbi:MAG TPA: valine--tRNA ligase, partial [Buchnera sp. (in: enterobacteria)]|nr:valine--tRNA ligase [Buchnera sp. (in: enterobacteria)]